METTRAEGFGLVPSILIACGMPLAGIVLMTLTLSSHQISQWDLAVVRQGEISTVQEELRVDQGSYAESAGELRDALRIAGLSQTAESIVDVTHSDSDWCVTINQKTGDRPDWALTLSSKEMEPEPFETQKEATDHCQALIR